MKTLDNVIEAMERCSIPHYFDCKGCPYEDDDAEVGCRSDDRDADALHYLKEYRDAYGNVIATMNHHLRKIHELEQNDPLTWDELRQMEGKPVWVECEYYPSQWAIITGVYDCKISFIGDRLLVSELKDEQGEIWQAYRKEHHG